MEDEGVNSDSKSDNEVDDRLDDEDQPASSSPVDDNDNDDGSSGDDDDGDDDDEEEIPLDKEHPSLIQSSSRTNSISHAHSHPHPPKSASLIATSPNDVYNFPSSPEEDKRKPKHFRRVGPSSPKRRKPKSPIEEEDSRLGEDLEAPPETEQRKRKVPPLRITLPIKPASDDDNTRDAEDKDRKEVSTKKPTRGRKPAAGSQRLTRSRLKEAAENPEKRNWRRSVTSSSLLGNAVDDDDDDDFGLSPGLGIDEDSQEAPQRELLPPVPPPVRAWDLIKSNIFKGNQGLHKLIFEKWSKDIKEYERPEDADVPPLNYAYYSSNCKDYHTRKSKWFPPLPNINPNMESRSKLLYIKQLRERREKEAEQEVERKRLQLFGEREFVRAEKELVVRERLKVSALRMLRDADACNPIVFDSFRAEPENCMVPETKEEVLEKLEFMASSLFNKHVLENQTLRVLQKEEFEKHLKEWNLIPQDKEVELKIAPLVPAHKVDFKYLTEEIAGKSDFFETASVKYDSDYEDDDMDKYDDEDVVKMETTSGHKLAKTTEDDREDEEENGEDEVDEEDIGD